MFFKDSCDIQHKKLREHKSTLHVFIIYIHKYNYIYNKILIIPIKVLISYKCMQSYTIYVWKNKNSEKCTYSDVHFQLFFFIFAIIFDLQITLWNSLKCTVIEDNMQRYSDSRGVGLRLSINWWAKNRKELLVEGLLQHLEMRKNMAHKRHQ